MEKNLEKMKEFAEKCRVAFYLLMVQCKNFIFLSYYMV